MPLGDRTGPRGMGPMTGRGAGYCAGFNTPGYMNPMAGGGGFGLGRGGGGWGGGGWGGGGWGGGGFGRGRGWGMGWGRMAVPTTGAYPVTAPNITPDQQKEFLQEQLKMMEQEMSALKKQLNSLEKKEEKK